MNGQTFSVELYGFAHSDPARSVAQIAQRFEVPEDRIAAMAQRVPCMVTKKCSWRQAEKYIGALLDSGAYVRVTDLGTNHSQVLEPPPPAVATTTKRVLEPTPPESATGVTGTRCISCQAMLPAGRSWCPQCGWDQRSTRRCLKCEGEVSSSLRCMRLGGEFLVYGVTGHDADVVRSASAAFYDSFAVER